MPITTLIVDDTEETREVLSMLVAQAGVQSIRTAPDGLTALALLETEPVDLVFTDYQMPGMDGIELSRELRRRYPRSTLVMITVLDDPELRRQAALAGVDMFLPKPISLGTLDTLIASLERIPHEAEDWNQWLAQWVSPRQEV